MRFLRPRLLAALVASAPAMASVMASAACAPSGPQVTAHSLTIPLEGPCPTTPGGAEFASEVTSLAATIAGPGIETPLVAEGDSTVTIPDVPAGDDRVIALFGLGSASLPTWRGVSRPTTTAAGKDTPVDILLAKVADFSCARNTSFEPRAFHTSTLLDDGTVLVVGGARNFADASQTCGRCKDAQASASAAIYDPKTGQFSEVGPLAAPRMFHTAVKLLDGRVVIAGGTGGAVFHPPDAGAFTFPIAPTSPVASIEVYDPAQKAFINGGVDPGGPRVFAAATTLLTGEAIITGGIPGAANPNNLGNALNTTTLCGGATFVCRAGPQMAARRAGHMAFNIDPEGVFLWGGSVEAGAGGFQIEFLKPGNEPFVFIDACEMDATKNVFFAAGTRYSGFRQLAAGGLFRRVEGTFHAKLDAESKGSGVLVFDLAISGTPPNTCETGVTSGTRADPMNLQGTRFLASAAGLPDEASALIVGGFEIPSGPGGPDFNATVFKPVETIERFVEAGLIIDNLSTGGIVPTLREPRAGATATAVGDGTVVIVGGAGTAGTIETAEVFADPKTPPQAAVLP